MTSMQQYNWIIFLSTTGLLLLLADFAIYYAIGKNHSKTPFIIGTAILVFYLVLTGVAAYQTYLHRNDSEKW